MYDGKSLVLPAGYSLDDGVLSTVSEGGLSEERRVIYQGNLLPHRTECRAADEPTLVYEGHIEAHPAGSDKLYVDVLQRILAEKWNTPSLWLALAFSLASPIIARMKPIRNPTLYSSGASGGG